MPTTIELPHYLTIRRQITLFLALTLLFSLSTLAQAPSLRVDVSAFSRATGTFDAYVDTRKLSAPLDVEIVILLIRCHLANGQLGIARVPFADQMLSRGLVYHKVLDLPPGCTGWDGLVSAEVPLALGKADGPDAEVSVKKGTIQGTTISLTPPLGAPQLSSPVHGSIFNHYPRKTVLNWLPVKGAGSYTLEIQMWSAGAWYPLHLVPNLRVNWHEFKFVGAQPGRWRVWAIRPDGSPGYASAWWKFSYKI